MSRDIRTLQSRTSEYDRAWKKRWAEQAHINALLLLINLSLLVGLLFLAFGGSDG